MKESSQIIAIFLPDYIYSKMRKLPNPKKLLIISFAVFLFFSFQIIGQSELGYLIDFHKASEYGTLLGGFFSFISVLLIYKTLTQQSEAFNSTQFENRLMEMIKIHRNNIDVLKMRSPDKADNKSVTGYKVVREIHKQVVDVMKLIELKFQPSSINEIYINEAKQKEDAENPVIIDRNIDLFKLNQISISYLCVFYGVSDEGRHNLENIFRQKYKPQFYEPLLDELSKKKAMWDTSRGKKFIKYYGGHQHRLGHLFRHLYNTVSYVNNNSEYNYKQKYELVRLLRGQLSTYEQSLLFFNSLSDLGRPWELNVEIPITILKKHDDTKLKMYRTQKMLITKYNLIRNIHNEFIKEVKINEYYPNIIFDGDIKTDSRIELERLYETNG